MSIAFSFGIAIGATIGLVVTVIKLTTILVATATEFVGEVVANEIRQVAESTPVGIKVH